MKNESRKKVSPSVCIVSTSFPIDEKSVSGTFVQQLAIALADYMQVEVLTADVFGKSAIATNKAYSLKSF